MTQKITNWSELLDKAQKNGGLPKTFLEKEYPVSVELNGTRLVYENGGRKIIDLKGNEWYLSEKDGIRWESINMTQDAEQILGAYKNLLQNGKEQKA